MSTTQDQYVAEFQSVKAEAAARFLDWGVIPNNVEWWQEVYRVIHERKERAAA